jgi:monoterpene epsilon-lactone hydrolase
MRLPLPAMAFALRWTVRPVLGARVPISAQRRWLDLMSGGTPKAKGVRVSNVVLGSVAARLYTPPDAMEDRAVVWVHGGAFVTGGYLTHGAFCSHLAAAVGAPVYLVDYRLAPEHPHPAAVDDVLAALRAVPESKVVLGGDSAGGALTLLAAPQSHRPLAGVALVSPMVDLTLESCRAWPGDDVLVRVAWGEVGVNAMFPGEKPDLTAVTDLPKTVVHVSEHERLRPEGEALAGRLGAELVLIRDGWHDIHLQAGLVQRGDEATATLGASVRALLA